MRIAFQESAQSSLGIEWELAVVDLATLEQVPGARHVLDGCDDPVTGPVRGEYLDSMLELVSGVHTTVSDAVEELSGRLQDVVTTLEPHGLSVTGVGVHPFGDPAAQQPVDKAQYNRVTERNGWWGQQMAINGLHIHAGVSHRDKALPITAGLARHFPHFMALTASSPFWHGADSGFASQRTMIFQQLPTNGLPYGMADWDEFEAYATQLEGVGLIHSPSEIRWDIRPTPFGTVENRAMDSVPTTFEIGAVAAFAQCLVEHLSREVEAGREVDGLPMWFLKENKWRAARYGLEAEIITGRAEEHTVLLRRDLLRLLDELSPIAEELGCAPELGDAGRLVADGPSYVRQRRAFAAADGDPRAVVRSLIRETMSGTPQEPTR